MKRRHNKVEELPLELGKKLVYCQIIDDESEDYEVCTGMLEVDDVVKYIKNKRILLAPGEKLYIVNRDDAENVITVYNKENNGLDCEFNDLGI